MERRLALPVRAAVTFVLALAVLGFLVAPPGAPTDRHDPSREVVRFWHPWTGEWNDVVRQIAARFNASQNRYEVVPLSVPGGDATQTKFMLSVSGGDPPDVVATWDPILALWSRDGILQPLDPFMSPGDRRAFQDLYPVAQRAGTYAGKVYGLSIGLNLPALYYRPADLRAAGLPDRPPRTLSELTAWGDRLTRDKPDGSLSRMGFIAGGLRDVAPLFGGGYGEGRIDTPGNRRALRWLTERRASIGFDRYARFQVGLGLDASGGSAEASWPFISGRYAMAMDGQWRVEQVARFAPEFARGYRTAPMPPPLGATPGAGYAVSTLLVIPSGSRHSQGAWEFARFWSGLKDPALAAEMNTLGGWLPSSAKMAAAPAYRDYVRRLPQFQTFIDALASPKLQTTPPLPDVSFLMDEAGKAEWLAISGAQKPDVALQAAQHALDRERARRRALGESL